MNEEHDEGSVLSLPALLSVGAGGHQDKLSLHTLSYIFTINKLKTLERSSLTLPSGVCVSVCACVLFTAMVWGVCVCVCVLFTAVVYCVCARVCYVQCCGLVCVCACVLFTATAPEPRTLPAT